VSDEKTIKPSEFEDKIDEAARRSVIDFAKDEIEGDDGEAVVLAEVFDAEIGKDWPSKLKRIVKNARKEVLDALRAQQFNPMDYADPFGTVVNTVGVRALEELMLAAEMYDSLEDLRGESDYTDPAVEGAEDPETGESTDTEKESAIYTPDL